MDIVLNGALTATISGSASSSELLAYLASDVVPSGHVIHSLRLAGRDFAELGAGDAAFDLDEVGPLEVSTGDQAQMLADATVEMRIWLPKLGEALSRCAELVRRGGGWTASYVQCLDGIEIFARYAQAARLLLLQRDAAPPPAIDTLDDTLRNLVRVHEIGDEVGVADTLEFEIAPLVTEWQTYLTRQSQ